MSKVINLNKARKSRARDDKRKRADRNAIRFGRTKARKGLEDAAAEKAARDLDGHKRE